MESANIEGFFTVPGTGRSLTRKHPLGSKGPLEDVFSMFLEEDGVIF